MTTRLATRNQRPTLTARMPSCHQDQIKCAGNRDRCRDKHSRSRTKRTSMSMKLRGRATRRTVTISTKRSHNSSRRVKGQNCEGQVTAADPRIKTYVKPRTTDLREMDSRWTMKMAASPRTTTISSAVNSCLKTVVGSKIEGRESKLRSREEVTHMMTESAHPQLTVAS